jgi:CcmD family protein
MYEFLQNNLLFVTLIIVLLIWVGLAFYMFYLDKKLRKLEIEVADRTSGQNRE